MDSYAVCVDCVRMYFVKEKGIQTVVSSGIALRSILKMGDLLAYPD